MVDFSKAFNAGSVLELEPGIFVCASLESDPNLDSLLSEAPEGTFCFSLGKIFVKASGVFTLYPPSSLSNDNHSGIECVLANETFRVDVNKQSVLHGGLKLDGCLEVEGTLILED